MKANELMIGDWVRPLKKKFGGIPGRIITIDGGTNTCWIDSDEYSCLVPCSDVERIPITPKILEKNGFERRDDLVERIEDPLPFIYEDKETTESVSVGWRDSYDNGLRDENAEYFEEYWKIWIDAFDASYEKTARILYVHELQHALRLVGIKKEIVL